MLKFFPYKTEAPLSGDIALEGYTAFNLRNWVQIDSNLDRCNGHILGANLQPIMIKVSSECHDYNWECLLNHYEILTILLVLHTDQSRTSPAIRSRTSCSTK